MPTGSKVYVSAPVLTANIDFTQFQSGQWFRLSDRPKPRTVRLARDRATGYYYLIERVKGQSLSLAAFLRAVNVPNNKVFTRVQSNENPE